MPGIKKNEAPARIGKGPSVLAYDATMIPNQAFKQFVIDTAEKEGIPYQLSVVAAGGDRRGEVPRGEGRGPGDRDRGANSVHPLPCCDRGPV